MALIAPISQSQYGRLFVGKYKTFEYDIAMEGNNLRFMSTAAGSLWPVQGGGVVKELTRRAGLDYSTMSSAERAPYANDMLDRIETKEIGKGFYAQAFAYALANVRDGFIVPEYIRLAILWACGIEEQAE